MGVQRNKNLPLITLLLLRNFGEEIFIKKVFVGKNYRNLKVLE
jgi:hypothetical protein